MKCLRDFAELHMIRGSQEPPFEASWMERIFRPALFWLMRSGSASGSARRIAET